MSTFLESDLFQESWTGELEEMENPYDMQGLKITYPVYYEVDLYKVEDDLELDLYLEYEVETNCSRCLIPVTEKVEDTSHFTIREGVELEEEEETDIDDIYYVEELKRFQLEDLLFSQIISSIPQKSLCKEECKGLCPQCGQDLNHGTCDCEQEESGNQFEILKELFTEK